MISPLESIQLARAERQMETVDVGENVRHDGWAIKPTQYEGRRRRHRRVKCLACDKPTWRGMSYCELHFGRVRVGLPVDADLYILTQAERKRLSSGVRFGGRLNLRGRK